MATKGSDNWEKSKAGFQSRISERQRQELLAVWSSNRWKTWVGRQFLNIEYGINVSERTLYNWKVNLRKLWNVRDRSPEMEVDWNNRMALSTLSAIPAEASELRRTLFELWQYMQRIPLSKTSNLININAPTYRHVKWWAYVHEYHLNTFREVSDIFYIAGQYMLREMLADWSKGPFFRKDLDQWLLFKPWTGNSEMSKYIKLVENAIVQRPKIYSTNPGTWVIFGDSLGDGYGFGSFEQQSSTFWGFSGAWRLQEESDLSRTPLDIDEMFNHEGASGYLLPSQSGDGRIPNIFGEQIDDMSSEDTFRGISFLSPFFSNDTSSKKDSEQLFEEDEPVKPFIQPF